MSSEMIWALDTYMKAAAITSDVPGQRSRDYSHADQMKALQDLKAFDILAGELLSGITLPDIGVLFYYSRNELSFSTWEEVTTEHAQLRAIAVEMGRHVLG